MSDEKHAMIIAAPVQPDWFFVPLSSEQFEKLMSPEGLEIDEYLEAVLKQGRGVVDGKEIKP